MNPYTYSRRFSQGSLTECPVHVLEKVFYLIHFRGILNIPWFPNACGTILVFVNELGCEMYRVRWSRRHWGGAQEDCVGRVSAVCMALASVSGLGCSSEPGCCSTVTHSTAHPHFTDFLNINCAISVKY